MSIPTAVAKHGINRLVDNIPEGHALDGGLLVKWLVQDFGEELRHELGRRCSAKAPTRRKAKPQKTIAVKAEKRLSNKEEAQLLALLEKQAGRG